MKFFIADGSKLGLRRLLMLLDSKKECELVGYAADVTAAIISIQTVKPQVVILDLNMGNKNGIDVLRTIKREIPDTIFIIATNAASEQHRKRCFEFGAEYFIDKSTEFSQIPSIMKKLADQLAQRKTNGMNT